MATPVSEKGMAGVIPPFTFTLVNTPDNFVAGKICSAFDNWTQLTSDKCILSWVRGVHIDFIENLVQSCIPSPICFGPGDCEKINAELQRLLSKGIIEFAEPVEGQFISNIFFRTKKDGAIRLILNLKQLNLNVEYHHFKMETLQAAIQLMTKNCFMASVDLKDAYYSVPVAAQDRKFLRFLWQNQLFQFTCLPNGLAEAPRKFTKMLKVPFAFLRRQGHASSAYIDDSCLLGQSKELCDDNVQTTVMLMDSLGFTVHPEKSSFQPSHILIYLGFVLNSLMMTVTLTEGKVQKIILMCKSLLRRTTCSIRQFAELIGNLVAAEPGVELAPLHYRRLEIAKVQALREHKGSYEATMRITDSIKVDLVWWIEKLPSLHRCLEKPSPVRTVFTDSSNFAWGAVCEGKSTGGPWVRQEKDWHINYKELMAAFFGLKVFCSELSHCHVKLFVDNTTALAYINNQGGRKPGLNGLARQLWLWAEERQIWVSAVHVPGTQNIEADRASRKTYAHEMEWQLDASVFQAIVAHCGDIKVDLFASRTNAQCMQYVSWKPDPFAFAVDAFTIDWNTQGLYAFPPFSVIGRLLTKLAREGASLVAVFPLWPNQPWFPRALQMSTDYPRLLPAKTDLLRLPQNPHKTHPFLHKLRLTLFRLSGQSGRVRVFQQQLPLWSPRAGGHPLANSTGLTCASGMCFAVNGRYLQCLPLQCNL